MVCYYLNIRFKGQRVNCTERNTKADSSTSEGGNTSFGVGTEKSLRYPQQDATGVCLYWDR